MLSGVYRIINTKNGKFYIGSSNNLSRRKREHFHTLRNGTNHSLILQKAFNKYGESNFKFEILARCPTKYLFKIEQWFVDNLKPKYNICVKDVSVPVGIPHVNYKDKDRYKEIALERHKTVDSFGWQSKRIAKLNDAGDILEEYDSLKKYADEHLCSVANVGKALKKKIKCRGFYVKYIT